MRLSIIFVILFTTIACSNGKKNSSQNYIVDKTVTLDNKKSNTLKKKLSSKTKVYKHNEHLYVINSQGISYWDKPNGNELGKLKLNQQLEVISKPFVEDSIQHSQIDFQTWYGVKYEKDTVYVLNNFLSKDYKQSDLELYFVEDIYDTKDNFQNNFINLSEKIGFSYESTETTILDENDLTKEVINLSIEQKKLILSKSGIKYTDTLYIFSLINDSVEKIPIEKVDAIANLNIYKRGSNNQYSSEYDYEFGLTISDKTIFNDGIVYIGKSCPFQTGKVEEIRWSKIPKNEFPSKFDSSIVYSRIRWWFRGIEAGNAYKYTNSKYNYYIQDLLRKDEVNYRYLVVIDSNKIIYETVFMDTESLDLIPLSLKEQMDSDDSYYKQWSGAIFRNKPPILYGFESNSFGCPGIDFISDTIPSVPILCDNRH